MIVDTGAPIHREHWLERVCSLVAPQDVRSLLLSHDDGDHAGGLHDVLDRCPNATLVTNFFATERLALERPLPLQRPRRLQPGEAFDAGDRTMRLVLPPILDGPTTRGRSTSAPARRRRACRRGSNRGGSPVRSCTAGRVGPWSHPHPKDHE